MQILVYTFFVAAVSEYMQNRRTQVHFPPHIAFLTFAVHLES